MPGSNGATTCYTIPMAPMVGQNIQYRASKILAPAPETRFTQSMLLRGVTAFITESCRVPGSQTWEDRIGQKVSVGKAILAAASASSSSLVELVSDVQSQSSKSPGIPDFVLLPLDQDPFTVGKSIDILLGHGVQLYRSQQEMDMPAVVVPLAQPLRPTIELLLSVDVGRHQALGASLGLRVVPASALSEAVRGSMGVNAARSRGRLELVCA